MNSSDSIPGGPPIPTQPTAASTPPPGNPLYPVPAISGYASAPVPLMRPPAAAVMYPPQYGAIQYSMPPMAPMPAVLPPPRPAPRPLYAQSRPPGQLAALPAGEKPQTTVYVGKIASTVDDAFLRRILGLCGHFTTWKRAQDPTTNALKGFGFCEFESAEGVLRALRLLNKFAVDRQELVLNVNQATRDYLERFVANKKLTARGPRLDDSRLLERPAEKPKKSGKKSDKKAEPVISPEEKKELEARAFGLVLVSDKLGDEAAMKVIVSLVDERLKTLPVPEASEAQPEVEVKPAAMDGAGSAAVEKEKPDQSVNQSEDSKSAPKAAGTSPRTEEGRADEEDAISRKLPAPDGRRGGGKGEEQLLDSRLKTRRVREREQLARDVERTLAQRLRDWEQRERDRERERQHDREREKERERERRRLVKEQEEASSDSEDRAGSRVRTEDKRRRMREEEDDEMDKLKEEKEKAEEEERKKRQAAELPFLAAMDIAPAPSPAASPPAPAPLPLPATPGDGSPAGEAEEVKSPQLSQPAAMEAEDAPLEVPAAAALVLDAAAMEREKESMAAEKETTESPSVVLSNGRSVVKLEREEPKKKLGFNLPGAGKRTLVSAFGIEEEENKVSKHRPLVPIDYEEEKYGSEVKDVGLESSLAAAAEFARKISGGKPAVMDAKTLIDSIPKTREELFSYEVNWAVFDKHGLQQKIRPWISKKIKEFLGEEEVSLVEFIIGNTEKHVPAEEMLKLLEDILDEEAEMFVLKMWRMLIFEVRRVETGLVK